MHPTTLLLLLGISTLASATPLSPTSPNGLVTRNPNCGPINGNCYDHNCQGQLGDKSWTCTAGDYVGCECGYNVSGGGWVGGNAME